MVKKPTYEELEQKVEELTNEAFERKRAEEVLYEQAQIVASIKHTILIITPELKTIYANQAAKDLFGDRPEMFTEPCYRFFKKRDNACENCPVLNVLNDEKPHQAIMKSFDKDGAEMWRFNTAYPYYDRNGRLIGGIEVVSDYTSQKQVEEKLKASEQRLAQIINFLPDATFVIDNEGKVIAWNQAIENMTSVKAEEILGKGDYEYTIPFYGERRPALIDLVSKWNKEIEEKYQYVKKEGESLVSETYDPLIKRGGFLWNKASLLYDHNGEVIGAIESIRDITDRKVAEEALRESEAKYRRLSENSPAVVYQFKMTPDEAFTLPYVSEKVMDIMGVTAEDVMRDSSNLIAMVHPEDQKMFVEGVLKSAETLKPYHAIFRCLKDGKVLWVEGRSTPDPMPDGSILWDGFFVDITERIRAREEKERLEANLRQSLKMESIGTLTSGIAHDFNNIIAIIAGNTGLALDDVPKWNPAHFNLQDIKEACLRAADTVKQLVSFSRKTEQRLRPIGIATVIEDTLKFLRSSIPATIELRKNIPATDKIILADPTQISQVIMNLCINAYQEMEQTGGILEITIENATLKEASANSYTDLSRGDYVKIVVRDTGPGIDSEIIDRIFDPYFTTKGPGKGTGMGLAVVQGIVNNHGGAITVDSEPGKGTTFTVFFPVVTEKPEVETETTDELPRGTEAILFIDDEKSIAKMTGQMLERLGYQVEAKTDPVEALELFQSKSDQFDLVITDVTMPQMTGVKLFEKLMEIRSDIPVIICTGHSVLVDEKKAKAMGVAAYIMKPFLRQDFAKTIRKVLDNPES